MERPPVEEWATDTKTNREQWFCEAYLALESQLKAEQKSVNELNLHCQDLELRLKRAEEQGFSGKVSNRILSHFTDKTLKDLAKGESNMGLYRANKPEHRYQSKAKTAPEP